MTQDTYVLLITVSIGITIIACMLPAYVFFGLRRLKKQDRFSVNTNPSQPFLSVIVAAHNEEKNISQCLDALMKQSYPVDKFEIIVVNDRSTDSTEEILNRYGKKYSNIRIVNVMETPINFSPKKYAIDQGIKNAKHDLLFFTDADCQPEQQWLALMTKYFSNDVGAVIGYSPICKSNSLVNRLSRFETYRTSAMMFAFAANGNPYMSVGRNWAYRKQAYRDVNGMESIQRSLSGDDDLLLQRIVKSSKWKIQSCFDQGAFCRTHSASSFREYITQKIRHFSASVSYPLSLKLIFGLSQIATLCCFLFSLFIDVRVHPIFLLLPLLPVSLQTGNMLVIAYSTEKIRLLDNIFSFLFEPVYVVFYSMLGLAGIMTKPDWK